MNISIRTRYRAALVATAALGLAASAVSPALAATTGPTAPTELFNGYQHCSTDPAAPVYLWAASGLTIEGIPQDTDAGAQPSAQFLVWPVSAPSETTSYSSIDNPAGGEASVVVPGNALADATTYAWQARSVAGSAVSKWSKTCFVAVDDERPSAAPTVSSANYPVGQSAPGGVPVQFTFGANGMSDVAGYEFAWDGNPLTVYVVGIGPRGVPEPKSIWADTQYYVQASSIGGDATVSLVPPNQWGTHTLTVVSLNRAYSISGQASYSFYLQSTAPAITPAVASPQFDVPTGFTFTPNPAAEAASPIVSYSVQVGDGTPRKVEAAPDGSAQVTLRLDQPDGNDAVTVTSTSANGWLSDPNFVYYSFDTTPIVNSTEYPEGATSGGVGIPGTFTFTPQVPNVAGYTYSFDSGATETTVAADKTGDAQITWTPTASGYYQMTVYGTLKNGLQLQYTDYYYFVN